jgi:hypothetical protein
MKKSLFAAAAVLSLLCSCQSNKAQLATGDLVIKPTTHRESVDTLRIVADGPVKPVEYGLLPEGDLVFLEKSNLSQWFNFDEDSYYSVFNGFYGADNHRIEWKFKSAAFNPQNKREILITGLTRFKKNIVPVSGVLYVDEARAFKDPNLDERDIKEMGLERLVEMSGRFVVNEDSTRSGSGQFTGTWALTLGLFEDGQRLWFASDNTKTRGAGMLLEGQWKSFRSGTVKPFLIAHDLFMVANDILEEFSIGERDVEINPKYRHLGWDEFWDASEWWVDAR